MQSLNRRARLAFLALLLLFVILALPTIMLAQTSDTVANKHQHQQAHTTKKTTSTSQQNAREI